MQSSNWRSWTWLALGLLFLARCGSDKPAGVTHAAETQQKTVRIPTFDVDVALGTVLGGLRLQVDQTDDPSHAKALATRDLQCTPASEAQKRACLAECVNPVPPLTVAACRQNCNTLQNCRADVCRSHATADYVIFGDTLKSFPLAQKKCTNPSDTCPSCTVDPTREVSSIEDLDITYKISDPIVVKDIVGPVSCRVNTFGIDLTSDFSNRVSTQYSAGKIVTTVKAFASQPTLRCTNTFELTFRHPTFDFVLTPSVQQHRANLLLQTSFDTHVDYVFDWIVSYDNEVRSIVNGAIAQLLSNTQGSINDKFDSWLRLQIDQIAHDKIDDLIAINVTPDGIDVTYTPAVCNADGVCSCTPDCNGRSCGKDAHCGTVDCGAACPAGKQCNPEGTACVCAPKCDGKSCGPDGCGGVCGPGCPGDLDSCVNGACCTRSCGNRHCGSDGCGGICGSCNPPRSVCTANGQCDFPACVPQCSGKVCGSDGCGGTCGTCGAGTACAGGRCVCDAECDGKCHINACGEACGYCAKGVCDINKYHHAFCNPKG